jgi:hypothetical protein
LKSVLKLTLLFSACFVSVVLLLVHEYSVRSLSPREFVVAFGLWCVAGSLLFVSGLFMHWKKGSPNSQDAAAAAPLDPATRKQRMFLIRVWKGVLFFACFVSVVLLLIHEYKAGSLSPRGFGTACGLLIGASYLVAVLGMVKGAAQSPVAAVAPLDPATRKQRTMAIKVWKGMIVLLVLGLVTGVGKARDFPVWEMGVIVAMNLTMTTSLIWVVVRLQRSLK